MKAVTVKYLPHNGKRGARLQASDMDRNRVQVPYDLPGADNEEREAKWRRAAVALYEKMNWSPHDRLVMGWVDDSVAVFVEVTTRDAIRVLLGDVKPFRSDGDLDLAEMRRRWSARAERMGDVYAAWISDCQQPSGPLTLEVLAGDCVMALAKSQRAEVLARIAKRVED